MILQGSWSVNPSTNQRKMAWLIMSGNLSKESGTKNPASFMAYTGKSSTIPPGSAWQAPPGDHHRRTLFFAAAVSMSPRACNAKKMLYIDCIDDVLYCTVTNVRVCRYKRCQNLQNNNSRPGHRRVRTAPDAVKRCPKPIF